jgi:general secretion pathway protein G
MHRASHPRASPGHGFTLIEVMVVVVILGLLATLVVPNVITHTETAKEEKAAADVHTIAGAVRLWHAQHGRFPELAELVRPDGKGKTYLDALSRDPWGGEYVLRIDDGSRTFEVVSAAADRELGSADEISSRTPPP